MRTSRSVRRVLFPRAVTPARATVIHLGPALPQGSSGLPDCASRKRIERAALEHSLSDLAPGGVYLAAAVTGGAGGLLHHRFTLTPGPRTEGGLFSVALSRGSPRVAVNHHLALWSPDVPRRAPEGARRDRPTDSSAGRRVPSTLRTARPFRRPRDSSAPARPPIPRESPSSRAGSPRSRPPGRPRTARGAGRRRRTAQRSVPASPRDCVR